METILVGEIGSAITGSARDEFIEKLIELRDGTDGDILLDYAGVENLSSISLAAVGKLHTWMEEHGRTLILRNLSSHLRQLFSITGLDKMMNIEEPT